MVANTENLLNVPMYSSKTLSEKHLTITISFIQEILVDKFIKFVQRIETKLLLVDCLTKMT